MQRSGTESVTQPWLREGARVDTPAVDGEQSGHLRSPFGICVGNELAGIALDGFDALDARGEPCGMDERAAWTGQVLNAQEQTELVGGRGHQKGVGVPLTRLQGCSRVAQVAGEEECFNVDEGFVDDDGTDFRRTMHVLVGPRGQVARGGLLHVMDRVKRVGGYLS